MRGAAALLTALILSQSLWALRRPIAPPPPEPDSTVKIQDAGALSWASLVLEGPWDYFEGAFIQPGSFYPKAETPVSESVATPSAAKEGELVYLPHQFSKDVHFGTYHCRVEGLAPQTRYAMTIYGRVLSSCRIWCNKRLVGAAGAVGKDGATARPAQSSDIVELPSDIDGVLDIVIQAADFELGKGGIIKPLVITEKPNLERKYLETLLFSTIIIAFFSVLIVYDLILMLMNRRPTMNFLFAVISGFFILTVAASGVSIFNLLFPAIPFWIEYRLPILLFTVGICTYITLLNFSHRISKRVGLPLYFASVFIAMAIAFMPTSSFERQRSVLTALAPSVLLLLLLLSFRLLFKKNLNGRKGFSITTILRNFDMLVNAGVLFAFFYDFLVAPNKPALVNSCLAFKMGLLMFGALQCATPTFRRYFDNYRIRKSSQRFQTNNNVIAKFIPEQTLKHINADSITKVLPGGCNVLDAMIVYIEIRYFSQLAESMDEKELYETLLEYYKNVAPIVREHGGYVAKYMLRGCLVIFTERNDSAIRCAMTVQRKMSDIAHTLRKNHNADISVGIAIHMGKIACGILGSERRFAFIESSEEIQNAIKIGKQTSKMDAKILISEDAMIYCRAYADCLFEGHFISVDGERLLVYSAIPFKDFKTDYIANFELADDAEVAELDEA